MEERGRITVKPADDYCDVKFIYILHEFLLADLQLQHDGT